MLLDMEERGIIEKSTSAWLSLIVLVNNDDSKRMCLDYRHVNTHLGMDIYPLPWLEIDLQEKKLAAIETSFGRRLDEQGNQILELSEKPD